MKKATIAGATFEFAEAQAQAIKDTVEKATAELKDDPEQLAEFLNEQVRKAVGMSSSSAKTQPPLEGKRILWVDDNPDGNTYEANLFRRLGAQVQFCVSTEDGVQALRENVYDLVVSDVYRRENGARNRSAGYDLLEKLKSDWPGMPLIFYTSNASRISPTRGKGAFGATDTADELSRLVIEAAKLR